MSEKPTEGKCVFCGNNIVEKIVKEFDPTTGPMIIGPDSINQFQEVSRGFHCQSCGLKYEFVPKNKVDADSLINHPSVQREFASFRRMGGKIKIDKHRVILSSVIMPLKTVELYAKRIFDLDTEKVLEIIVENKA